MATGGIVAGKGLLRVATTIYNCTEIRIAPGGETCTKLVGMLGPAGDVITMVAPKLTATVIVTPDVDITILGAYRNERAEVEFSDGRSYVLEGASTANQPEHDIAAGTCDLSMEAMSGTGSGA
jgi:hypothetical protein